MRKRLKTSFDPKLFLAKVGEEKRYPNIGKIKLSFRKDKSRTLFFTSGKARSSLLLFPSKARKPSLRSSGPVTFSAKAVSTAIHCASQQLGPLMNA